MGADMLGKNNIKWAQRIENIPGTVPGSGPMTLLKAILNDYWADPFPNSKAWESYKVDEVMSKLYWCWVAWLDCTHYEVEEE